jgi:uncharacterized protein (DUF1800 family)
MSQRLGAIAATRFGLGARPGEIVAAASDPRGWLKAQIRPDAAVIPEGDLPSSREVFTARRDAVAASAQGAMRRSGASGEAQAGRAEAGRLIQQQVQREVRDNLQKETTARIRHAATTADSFAERWLRFWSNHFTVSARNAQLIGLVGPFEREAIRPRIFGSFAGLLGAASLHPGMLTYLDAANSIGPSTEIAVRRKAGLNENLAREILELHTLGVGAGYSQDDIVEFAKALTGWTIASGPTARLAGLASISGAGPRRRNAALREAALEFQREFGETIFMEALHEPGPRTVLAKSYGGSSRSQAPAILDDLARHPATARHIAVKLARHFVSDAPPSSAIAQLEGVFRKTDGDLAELARSVVDLDEAWGDTQKKFKTPDELLISAARAAGVDDAFGGGLRQVYISLAQQPFSAPSPAGWPDDTASWSGADAVMKRIEWANAVARRMARSESPLQFLDRSLGELAGGKTRQAVARAESAEQGLVIALMSPEFQRR